MLIKLTMIGSSGEELPSWTSADTITDLHRCHSADERLKTVVCFRTDDTYEVMEEMDDLAHAINAALVTQHHHTRAHFPVINNNLPTFTQDGPSCTP